MDNCKHVKKLSMARNHSILNPQKWLCSVCGTTESVWACLNCANVACGRYNEEHALQHFKETQHCLAIEVNEKYVFCYECDDYVLNDNNAGELRMIRGCLRAVATQSLDELRQLKTSRLLRSSSARNLIDAQKGETLKNEDRAYTVLRFRRHYLLQRIFSAWKSEVATLKADKKEPVKVKVEGSVAKVAASQPSTSKTVKGEPVASASHSTEELASAATPARKKGAFIPGVIGLRNLGNTCYMNSILQVLSQVSECRDFVLYHLSSLPFSGDSDSSPSRPSWAGSGAHVKYSKQTSVDLYTHVISGLKKGGGGLSAGGVGGKKSGRGRPPGGGLNGGSSSFSDNQQPTAGSSSGEPVSMDTDGWSLGHELYALFRVMWSGKWALVSPHKILAAVWKAIPYFRGYTQHDAQEFLCEFLDKLQSQLNEHQLPALPAHLNLPRTVRDIFEGSLVSEVKCLTCDTTTVREEPFMDLSLEFPSRYQVPSGSSMFADSHPCSIEEMLFNFTAMEKLEGRVYACEACNSSRRRASRHQVLCEAEKRLRIKTLPHTLRLHLKRFMWSGRNIRCKISSHVDFGQQLNLAPYCERQAGDREPVTYRLTAVVIHHGRGFGSGHYTSYCWNSDIGAWMHCNDAIVDMATLYDVLKAQAYILVYTREDGSDSRQNDAAGISGVNHWTPLANDTGSDDAIFPLSYSSNTVATHTSAKVSLGSRVPKGPADCTDDLATDGESLAGDNADLSCAVAATSSKGSTRRAGRPPKSRTGVKRANSKEAEGTSDAARSRSSGRKRRRTSQ